VRLAALPAGARDAGVALHGGGGGGRSCFLTWDAAAAAARVLVGGERVEAAEGSGGRVI